ncbi:MAG: NAD-dependent protein deacetylase, partial [Myxococcaceae bacterium]
MFRREALVLTGAGCSTESGIPDYRGPESRKKPRRPIQFREFMTRPEMRVRYWARSALGWPRFREFQPNGGHRALAALQKDGVVGTVITQNVDRLHAKAGSSRVIELHGALAETLCMGCGERGARDELQSRIHSANPVFANVDVPLAPDGDADIPEEALRDFVVPPCVKCGGVLKPDVVLFGENVPKARVEECFKTLQFADLLVVVGSSLAVFSGYRFVLKAKELGIPVAIVNLGESRGDACADVRVDAPAGEVLTRVAAMLGAA